MAHDYAAEQRTKKILKTLGLICMVGGILLMFSKYFFRDAFPVKSDTTVFYITTFGGFGLIVLGFVLLKYSKRIIPHDEPQIIKQDPKPSGPKKGKKAIEIRVGEKPPKEEEYHSSKMKKFLIDPEDMKKKK